MLAVTGPRQSGKTLWAACVATYVERDLRQLLDVGKRLVKAPRLYFLDTGLLCHLLHIGCAEDLQVQASRGAVFESWVLASPGSAPFAGEAQEDAGVRARLHAVAAACADAKKLTKSQN